MVSPDDDYDDLPLVYSCSGCSSAAQLANDIAVALDRQRIAEMSCIAGVGGGVVPLVDAATAASEDDRPIVAIDGCPLECAKACLADHDVIPDQHYVLAAEGVPKAYHTDYDDAQFERLRDAIADDVAALADAQTASSG